MITGSIASSIQGEPRLTHDIDIVIVTIPLSAVNALKKIFPSPDYYLDELSMQDANRYRTMFNLIEMTSGNKVDFWMLTADAFDQSRFARKYMLELKGIPVKFCRPEDTILSKLRWAKMSGGSEKQFTDALRVYELQYHTLDLGYIEHWSKELEIQELWNRLKEEADVL